MRIVALTFIKSATNMLLWFYKLRVRMMLSMKLVFYGAGNMAQAIFKGIINSKIKSHMIFT